MVVGTGWSAGIRAAAPCVWPTGSGTQSKPILGVEAYPAQDRGSKARPTAAEVRGKI